MAASGSYLPPVIVQLQGDIGDLIKKIKEAQALLAKFSQSNPDATLGVDQGPLDAGLASAEAKLKAFGSQTFSPKIRPDWGALSALGIAPYTGNIAAHNFIMQGVAQQAVRDSIARMQADNGTALGVIGAMNGARGGGGGGIGGFLLGLLGGGAGRGGIGAALGAAGWGKGLFGMAGFGTVLGMMGFGAEHILATALGVGGTAVGGLLGGGLLGLGSLGVMGTGMATDAAGMGQAFNDIKATVQAQNALEQAIAVYGKNSIQAAQAQAQLNFVVSEFPKAAQSAIVATANIAQNFHKMFNAATGPAEAIGAQIIGQGMKTGEAFLPTLGLFAKQNMGIIQTALNQPFNPAHPQNAGLFSWLKNAGPTGGLGIFTNLNRIFQRNLPTSIDALTQGLMFGAKTVNVAGGKSGGFIGSLDKFFTHMNQPGPFKKWTKDIGTLISLFHTLMSFIGTLGHTVYDLFKPAVGAGKAIFQVFTGALKQIDGWLQKGSTQKALKNLFGAHLGQIKAIGGAIQGLLPILESAALDFLKVAAGGARFAAWILTGLTKVFDWVDVHPLAKKILGWSLALLAMVPAIKAVWAGLGALTFGFNPLAIAIEAVIALVILMATHWQTTKRIFDDVWHGIEHAAGLAVSFLITLFRHWVDMELNFFGMIIDGAAKLFGWVPGIGPKLKDAAKAFDTFHTQVDTTLSTIAQDATHWGQTVAYNFSAGVIAGMEANIGKVSAVAKTHASQIVKNYQATLKVHSPSLVMMEIGRNVSWGLALGMEQGYSQHVLPALAHITGGVQGAFGSSANIPRLGSGGGNAQLARIEQALLRLLEESRMTSNASQMTSEAAQAQLQTQQAQLERLQTLQVMTPSGTAAMIRQNNAAIVTGIRAGSSGQ